MSVENNFNLNLNLYYEELISNMRERMQREEKEDPSVEHCEARARAWDEGLMYYQDQACIVAYAIMQGVIKWGEPVNWDDVYNMLCEDMEEA